MQDVHERNTEQSEISTDAQYYLKIYGRIPESGLMVSFRRVSRVRSYGRKIVKCPYCSCKITDTDSNTKVEVVSSALYDPVEYTLYLTCNSCTRDVGVKIIIPIY